MNYTKNLTLILILFSSILIGQTQQYCHLQSDICIEFPSNVFTQQNTNGNIIQLSDEKGNAFFVIHSDEMNSGVSLNTEYKNFLNSLIQSEGMISVLDKKNEKNMVEATLKANNKHFYIKIELHENHVIALFLKSNLHDSKESIFALNKLASSISLNKNALQNPIVKISQQMNRNDN